jgi:antitoxin YefM
MIILCHSEHWTAFLLRSPENARRLLRSVAELEAGKGKEKELED